MAGINVGSGFNRVSAQPLDLHSTQPDITARDAIASGVRYLGMVVFVEDSDGSGTPENYQLKEGITNSDWEVFGGGGSSGSFTEPEIQIGISYDQTVNTYTTTKDNLYIYGPLTIVGTLTIASNTTMHVL